MSSVLVSDQDNALTFYTDVLGFIKKQCLVSAERAISVEIPSIKTDFRDDVCPDLMLILFFGISRQLAGSDTTAKLALPFSGLAVTRTFNMSPSQPASTFFEEPGTTLILILA